MYQPPSYPPAPPGNRPARTRRGQPLIVWFFIALLVGGVLYIVGSLVLFGARTETRFIEAKPTVTASELIWFDVGGQMSDTITQRVFETQGLLQLEYSCLFDSDDGNDISINISILDPERLDTTVFIKRLHCPTSGSSSVSLESGRYMLTVYSFGESGWSLKLYQTL